MLLTHPKVCCSARPKACKSNHEAILPSSTMSNYSPSLTPFEHSSLPSYSMSDSPARHPVCKSNPEAPLPSPPFSGFSSPLTSFHSISPSIPPYFLSRGSSSVTLSPPLLSDDTANCSTTCFSSPCYSPSLSSYLTSSCLSPPDPGPSHSSLSHASSPHEMVEIALNLLPKRSPTVVPSGNPTGGSTVMHFPSTPTFDLATSDPMTNRPSLPFLCNSPSVSSSLMSSNTKLSDHNHDNNHTLSIRSTSSPHSTCGSPLIINPPSAQTRGLSFSALPFSPRALTQDPLSFHPPVGIRPPRPSTPYDPNAVFDYDSDEDLSIYCDSSDDERDCSYDESSSSFVTLTSSFPSFSGPSLGGLLSWRESQNTDFFSKDQSPPIVPFNSGVSFPISSSSSLPADLDSHLSSDFMWESPAAACDSSTDDCCFLCPSTSTITPTLLTDSTPASSSDLLPVSFYSPDLPISSTSLLTLSTSETSITPHLFTSIFFHPSSSISSVATLESKTHDDVCGLQEAVPTVSPFGRPTLNITAIPTLPLEPSSFSAATYLPTLPLSVPLIRTSSASPSSLGERNLSFPFPLSDPPWGRALRPRRSRPPLAVRPAADFSLSANESPRAPPNRPSHVRPPFLRPLRPLILKMHWIPRSSARKRLYLRRLRRCHTLPSRPFHNPKHRLTIAYPTDIKNPNIKTNRDFMTYHDSFLLPNVLSDWEVKAG